MSLAPSIIFAHTSFGHCHKQHAGVRGKCAQCVWSGRMTQCFKADKFTYLSLCRDPQCARRASPPWAHGTPETRPAQMHSATLPVPHYPAPPCSLPFPHPARCVRPAAPLCGGARRFPVRQLKLSSKLACLGVQETSHLAPRHTE